MYIFPLPELLDVAMHASPGVAISFQEEVIIDGKREQECTSNSCGSPLWFVGLCRILGLAVLRALPGRRGSDRTPRHAKGRGDFRLAGAPLQQRDDCQVWGQAR